MPILDIATLILYFAILAVLSMYGSHRYFMAYLYYRHKKQPMLPKARLDSLPRVTIQLPIYNEMYVAERLIGSVCQLEYPRSLLEIQVLDDSNDETRQIARACVERWRQEGIDIHYVRREGRKGFKAGALANGLKLAKGELVAVFDADFVPLPDFLHRTIHHFSDTGVGMVQVRWGHINREFSILTQAQSILLDGHFIIEHTARNRSGRFFNFNGTAGIWRRQTIEDAGGWQHDTLTEDLDLSYRAQLRGWRFVFLPDVVAPAEVPVEMNAFKSQQHRWAKGSIQTAMKLLPRIFRSDLPWRVKQEAFFHLTANVAYLLMVPASLLMPLTLARRIELGWHNALLLDLPFFVGATLSVGFFYVATQREIGASWWQRVKYLPFLMAIGIGLAVNNARAVAEALVGYQTEFTRTPKLGVSGRGEQWSKKRYRVAMRIQPLIELGIGVYLAYGVYYAFQARAYLSLPFLALFQAGFTYVGFTSIFQSARGAWARSRQPEPEAERMAA